MKPNISAYHSAIRTALADNGWGIESTDEHDAWWCHELWQLESLWAPRGLKGFLSFLIDPQADAQGLQRKEYKVWAVKASRGIPVQWQDSDSELTFSLSGNWRERIPALIAHLDKWRNEEQFDRNGPSA